MHIEDQIRQFVHKNFIFVQGDSLSDDASFVDTGVVDSMGVMELVAFVESEWGIKVDTEELTLDNFDSVRKLASFLRRKLSLPQEDGSALLLRSVEEPSRLHRANDSTI